MPSLGHDGTTKDIDQGYSQLLSTQSLLGEIRLDGHCDLSPNSPGDLPFPPYPSALKVYDSRFYPYRRPYRLRGANKPWSLYL